MIHPWTYPEERYYYNLWEGPVRPGHPTDREIKKVVVERLKENPRTKDDDIQVDVKQSVDPRRGGVLVAGETCRGRRRVEAAGVVDVSNQL
jgi:hypothetical protein